MIRAAILAIGLLVLSAPLLAQDQYGGDEKHPCPRGKTGHFYLYKDTNASRWFFCDPEGNRFFLIGIQVFDAVGINTVVQNKYGGGLYDAYSQLVKRFRSLGFTAITEYANLHALPISTHGSSDGGNPVKMPFVYLWRPSWYALFSSPAVKDLLDDQSPVYTGYRGGQFADVWDANWARGVAWVFSNSNPDFTGGIAGLNASPWCIGVTVDDSDNLEGFKAGPSAGSYVPHDGWLVGVASPYRIYSQIWGVVYADTTLHLKAQWQSYLQSKYLTISALNTAWGSSYISFGTTASQVSSEKIGTGDGTTTTFSHTFAHRLVDVASVGIFVGGTLLGGDCPWFTIENGQNANCASAGTGNGTVSGISESNISRGTVTYATGAITVTFSTPPAAGVAITASYRHGGWPKKYSGGTGLLDEDGSSSWWPRDWRVPKNTGAVAADLDAFLGKIAEQYFKTIHDVAKAKNPNHLVFAGDALNAYTRPPILSQLGKYMDAAILSSAEPPANNAQLIADYNSMGIPIIPWTTVLANADSPMSATNCSQDWPGLCLSTQAQRGELYAQFGKGWWNLAGADGYGFIVGWDYWQAIDNPGERMNFGLVTLNDNLYNGIEARVARCKDPSGFPCGGEEKEYGDFISRVKATNRIWLKKAGPSQPGGR